MEKIFLTCFEPFGSRSINISQMVVDRIRINDNRLLEKKTLKVSYLDIDKEISEILNTNCDYLLLTGEAGSRAHISLEKVAINQKSAKISDNYGVLFVNKRIDEDNNEYYTNIDVEKLNKILQEKGFDTEVSNNAGTFLCNMSYFLALRHVKKYNLKTKVLFIHFPTDENRLLEYQRTLEEILELL